MRGVLPGSELLLCVSQEATGWINIHVEQQQMPPSPSNARSPPVLSTHIQPPTHSLHLTSLSLSLSFNEDCPPTLVLPSFSFSHLAILYSLPMLSQILLSSPSLSPFLCFYSLSLLHADRLHAPGAAAYPPYSLVVSPDYFSGGHPVCALHHTVLSRLSNGSEWIRAGGASCFGSWQTGGP